MISDTLAVVMMTAWLASAGDHAALYQGSFEPPFVQSLWINHPYWESKDFVVGDICYDGVLYKSVPIRYNIFQNIVSVKSPEGNYLLSPQMDKIGYFVLDGKLYVPHLGWFWCKLHDGRHIDLLLDRRKVVNNSVSVDGHALKELVTRDIFYLQTADGQLHEVKKLSSLCRLYPQYRSQLKQFARDRKLNFSERRRLESLSAAVDELDSLLAIDYAHHPAKAAEGAEEKVETEMRTVIASGHIPDSVSAGITPVEQVAAFRIYAPGSTITPEYADDDPEDEAPGISALATLRESRTLEEVEVMGFRNRQSMQQSGMEAFRPSLLRNVPQVMGEADVLKLAMSLPGVSSTGEFSSGLNVRGGSSEQTLMLYNGNTIFNPVHMFGLFSTFNPDLVSESELYKGGIPSQYGGRLSSVMNIKGRIADKQKFHGSLSLGLVTTKGYVETPIVKDRVSLIAGGRTTYSDWMLKRLPESSGYKNGSAGFWDAGGLLNCVLNDDNTLLVSAYYSHDRFSFVKGQKYQYTNADYSVSLRSRYSERISSAITAGYDHYAYRNDDTSSPFEAARLSFSLSQFFLKDVLTFKLNDAHALNGGYDGRLFQLMPGRYEPLGEESYVVEHQLHDDNAIEHAIFAEDEWKATDALTITTGARLNLFRSLKEDLETTYCSPEIRIAATYAFNDNQSVKAGFNTLHQYLHKVSNTVVMSPTDIWLLSNRAVRPQQGWQASVGYYWQSDDMVYELSAEAYYKSMNDYLTYRSGAQLVMNDSLHNDVVGTRGRAMGIELQLRKLTGRLNGWVNYTYSSTKMRQEKGDGWRINDGEWFDADYDIPHNFKLVGNYKFTRRYSTSLNANYSTGRPFTAPVAMMFNEKTQMPVAVYSSRNACRMPYYFRVDWSFNIEPSHHLTELTHRWLTVGVYNLLGRRNAYSIYYESSYERVRGYKLSIFGAPIPYISYNIKFH